MLPKEAIERGARLIDSGLVGVTSGGITTLGVTADLVTRSDREALPRMMAEHCGNFAAPALLPLAAGLVGTLIEIKGRRESRESLERWGRSFYHGMIIFALGLNFGAESQFLSHPELLKENAVDCAVGLFAIGMTAVFTRHLNRILKKWVLAKEQKLTFLL